MGTCQFCGNGKEVVLLCGDRIGIVKASGECQRLAIHVPGSCPVAPLMKVRALLCGESNQIARSDERHVQPPALAHRHWTVQPRKDVLRREQQRDEQYE